MCGSLRPRSPQGTSQLAISGHVFVSRVSPFLRPGPSSTQSTPAACRARRASVHSVRCRATQSASWHGVPQYRARGPLAGQREHDLRRGVAPTTAAAAAAAAAAPTPAAPAAVAAAVAAAFLDRPEDVMPHELQQLRRSTASISAKSACGLSLARVRAMSSAVDPATTTGMSATYDAESSVVILVPSAPRSRSSFARLAWPPMIASMSGVKPAHPVVRTWLMFAPASRRAVATWSLPMLQMTQSGVKPDWSMGSGSVRKQERGVVALDGSALRRHA